MVNNLLSLRDNPIYHRFITERLDLLKNVPLWRMDARDYTVMSPSIAEFNPDVIVHLAAVSHIDRANKSPRSTFDHSLQTLENSLDIAKSLNCGLVYFSSSTVYGDFSQEIIDEDEPLEPKGIYGNLKACGELLCKAYHQTYGIPIVIIRPQALYGPRCISGRVTQVFIERAREGLPLQVHGKGDARHDFTYINDLVSALKRVLDMDFKRSFMRIWNVSAENAARMDELASIVAQRYGVAVEHTGEDSGKPKRGTMSCARIREELGWSPVYDLAGGMTLYMDWYDFGSGQKDYGGGRSTAA